MYDFLYYLALPFVIAGASFASCYILYPREFERYMIGASWNITKFIVECNGVKEKLDDKLGTIKNNLFNKNTNKSDFDSETDFSDDDEYDEIIGYNHHVKCSFSHDINDIHTNTDIINNENINVLFYHHLEGDSEQYKRIADFDDLRKLKNDEMELDSVDKQFIQVEYITTDENNDENIVDIHSHLGDFYVRDNIILDKYFLEWYLETFYDITIKDEYKLRFFDKDVNMFTLTSNNAIMIYNNTYTKLDIDDNTFILREDSYEGAENEDKEE